jgi:hypothetical protein
LCESFRLPVISLCDTPGFMVGPETEKEAAVRRFGRMFVLGARLTTPLGMIILRKGYGLGAMAMAGGSFRAPQFTVAWPTGEIGGMGLEGAVRLGFSKRQGAAVGHHVRARRRDRPRGLASLDYQALGRLRVNPLLSVAGAATDARQAALAARHAAGAEELAAGAAADARNAALAAGTAAGSVHAAGAAVAVGIAAAAARVVLEDDVRGCRCVHRWSGRENVSRGRRGGGDRRGNGAGHHQWFHEGQFR